MTAEIDLTALARTAYDAYGTSAEWIAHTGAPMPTWEALPERTQEHWRQAVRVVVYNAGHTMGAPDDTAKPARHAAPDEGR